MTTPFTTLVSTYPNATQRDQTYSTHCNRHAPANLTGCRSAGRPSKRSSKPLPNGTNADPRRGLGKAGDRQRTADDNSELTQGTRKPWQQTRGHWVLPCTTATPNAGRRHSLDTNARDTNARDTYAWERHSRDTTRLEQTLKEGNWNKREPGTLALTKTGGGRRTPRSQQAGGETLGTEAPALGRPPLRNN